MKKLICTLLFLNILYVVLSAPIMWQYSTLRLQKWGYDSLADKVTPIDQAQGQASQAMPLAVPLAMLCGDNNSDATLICKTLDKAEAR